jgi:transcriptional regulator with XRE-family HTH domain
MIGVTFRERQEQEFAARRAVNGRYSLRAFAGLLGVDHATLSQILRGRRSVPLERIGLWARKLKLSDEEAAVYAAVARVLDEQARVSQEALRHWASEMLSLLSDRVHCEILRLTHAKNFKSDSRWIAEQTGVGVDDVNIALSRLLRLGLLETTAAGWKDKTGLADITAQSFRRYIAERIPNPLTKGA